MPHEIPSDKSYTIAVCLSAIFGVVGIQHFYLERWFEAFVDLALFIATIYLFATGKPLWGIVTGAIDALHTLIVTIMLLVGAFRDGKGRLICYPGQKLAPSNGDST